MSRGAPAKHNAFSLVEMMAAMTVLSILAVGVGATMAIASRAVDDGTAPGSQIPEARNIGDVIIADLNDALTITERTDKSITFTVPDRDDDDTDETIRYAWDGKEGGNLTRKYNNTVAIVIAEDVHRFDLSYLTRTIKPLPRACCFGDGTCEDVSPDDCTSNGGVAKTRNSFCESTDCIGACCMENGSCVDTTELKCTQNPSNRYRGDGSRCADAACPNALEVLMVVSEGSSPVALDTAKQALMESWGYSVSYVDDGASQSVIDAAVAGADVAYVSETTSSSALGAKLANVSIGVVNEESSLADEFGFTAASGSGVSTTTFTVVDNTHHITSKFRKTPITATNSDQPFTYNSGAMATGVLVLATVSNESALFVVEAGDDLIGGSPAPGRRVQLPWGGSGFVATELTDSGQEAMKAAIEWAASKDEATPYCGDGNCDDGEDPCSCEDDCGSQTVNEQASFNCADGVDNDCDGNADCADSDCDADPSCAGVCGDANCDPSENSCNCAADCGPAVVSETGHGCSDGEDNDCDGLIDCNDSDCTGEAACTVVCGDSKCSAGEDSCNCSADCGAAPLTEENCEDSEDNDCDGSTDCDDSDCADDAACADSCPCDGNYADDFDSQTFGGSTGTLDWSADAWVEFGETDGATVGNVKIAAVATSKFLEFSGGDGGGEGIQRLINVCPSGTVSLNIEFARKGLDDANDYVALEISTAGGSGPWTEVTRFAGSANDGSFLPLVIDISAYAGATTWIRLVTSAGLGGGDKVCLDNLSVTCSP